MPPPQQTPDASTIFQQIISAAAGKVLAAEVGYVTEYDGILKRATVQPILHNYYLDTSDTGHEKEFQKPVANVPVLWPQWATGALIGTLAVGDRVLLIIAGRSLDEFKATNADNIQQQDKRRHAYQDAVAFPFSVLGVDATQYAEGAVTLSGADVRLGSALAVSPVALSVPVGTNFDALRTLLVSIATIPTNPAEPTASAIIAAVAVFLVASGYPVATGAANVKAL